MKLKNQFLRLSAVLGLSMAATSAWADQEFDPDVHNDGGNYYVNMPEPLATQTEGKATATWNVPGNVKTFHVYDDGGSNGKFTSTACAAGCSSNLLLTAPEGSKLRVKGSLTSGSPGDRVILDVINGSVYDNAQSLIYMYEDGNVTSWKTSSGKNVLIVFRTNSNANSSSNLEGMDLTVEVIPGTLVINTSGSGNYEVSSAAGQFDLQIPAGTVNNTTTLNAPAGYVLYVEGGIAVPSGSSVTAYDGANTNANQLFATTGASNTESALSSTNSVTIQTATTGSDFAEAQNVTVHVLKKTTTTAVDYYAQDDGSYAIAKIKDVQTGTVNIDPIVADVIEYDRTFTAGTPSTIVLPFQLPAGAETNGKFYYLKKIVQVTGECRWKATMTWIRAKNADALPEANTPYAVIIPEGTELWFKLNGNRTTIQTGKLAEQPDVNGNWIFKGTYEYKAWETESDGIGLDYAIAKTAGEGYKAGDFVKIGSGVTSAPMRAYISKANSGVTLQPVGNARPLAQSEISSIENLPESIDVEFVDEEEKTTAIGRLNTVTGAIKIDRWFDLKGRSTNHKPTTKGAFFNKKGIAK